MPTEGSVSYIEGLLINTVLEMMEEQSDEMITAATIGEAAALEKLKIVR